MKVNLVILFLLTIILESCSFLYDTQYSPDVNVETTTPNPYYLEGNLLGELHSEKVTSHIIYPSGAIIFLHDPNFILEVDRQLYLEDPSSNWSLQRGGGIAFMNDVGHKNQRFRILLRPGETVPEHVDKFLSAYPSYLQGKEDITKFTYTTGYTNRPPCEGCIGNWEANYENRIFKQNIINVIDLASTNIENKYVSTRTLKINILDFNSHRPLKTKDITYNITADNLTSAKSCISTAIAKTLRADFPPIPEIIPTDKRKEYSRDAYVSLITRKLWPSSNTLCVEHNSLQFNSESEVAISIFCSTFQPLSKIPMHIEVTAEGYHFFEADINLSPDDKEIDIQMTDIGSKLRLEVVKPGQERMNIRTKK